MSVAVAKKKGDKPTSAKELRALVKSFPWDDWNKDLEKGMTQIYRDVVEVSGKALGDQHGIEFDIDDPFVSEHMKDYIGERIIQLTKTTQKDLVKTLQAAIAGGEELGIAELQERILEKVREKYSDWESWRALRIARTESAISYNHGNVLGSLQAGFKSVDVVDGTDDEACAEANGAVWSIDRALNNPLGHPNCTRAFFPHVDDED